MDAVDAVDVVAPTNALHELCRMAIRKGKHVFVEKPLDNTMEEARKLIKLVQEECGLGSERVRAPRLPLTGAEREMALAVIHERLARAKGATPVLITPLARRKFERGSKSDQLLDTHGAYAGAVRALAAHPPARITASMPRESSLMR